jgi:DNA-binding FadR family transcriptional regulator
MADFDKRPLLGPLAPARYRATEVSERIATGIRSGRLAPGERLPPEHKLMAAMGVSRSVIREAVAALRSEGLVVTRQGAGAFVASDPARVPFRIDPDRLSSMGDIVHIMELRLAIEVEASALAAERARAAAMKSIGRALKAIDRAIGEGEAAIAEDVAFHRAIAVATGNPMFDSFLVFLGHHLIPRQQVRAEITPGPARKAYLEKIQGEHRLIADAIGQRETSRARDAMRAHLANGLRRYRDLARRFPKTCGETASA